jgi:multidrug efflux pump subunit AcrA (membrane-fusion protein)
MKYLFIRLIIVLIIISSCNAKKEKAKAIYLPLTEVVYASGNIKSYNQYTVYAAASGVLKNRYVNEYDLVEPGQLLAEINYEAGNYQIDNASALLEEAKRNISRDSPILKQLDIDIQIARIKMLDDSINMERYRNLFKNNIGKKIDLEQQELNYFNSKSRYEALLLKRSDTEKSLITKYENAQYSYMISKAGKNDRILRSFIQGKVYFFYKKPGEMIQINDPIALLGDAHKFIAELIIDEIEINRIKKDQMVLLTLDSHGEQIFTARVSKIYPALDKRTRTFIVEAEFDTIPTNLYPGLTVEANIIINKKDSALVIPKKFLLQGDSVFLDNGKQKVTTGLKNLEYVEILSGLDTTTYIYK